MKQVLCAVVAMVATFVLAACGSGSKGGVGPMQVILTNQFQSVEAGADSITILAEVAGPGGDQGVAWYLTVGGASCSPSCGTLKPAPAPSMSAVYTPPKAVPAKITATITAKAIADATQTFGFSFQIQPTVLVTISDPFQAVVPGGPVTDIHAGVQNDAGNAGVIWSLTANGQNCSPACGTLVGDAPQLLTAHYQPPATIPTGPAQNPVITATSVAASSKSTSFRFSIGPLTVSVSITNPFTAQLVGAPAVTVRATVLNDVATAGVLWTLTVAGEPCSPICGTLTQVGSPSVNATYTPPAALPGGALANPTITAISVSDNSKSDSFAFTVANAALSGHYAFQLRGFNKSGTGPVAIAGAFVADITGGISKAEFEVNNGGNVVTFPGPLGGTYDLDTTFNGIPRITITLQSSPVNLVLKCALSADGKLGHIVQEDGNGFLTSGTLLLQDPAALTADPAGSYAFGVDSDAPVAQRIVEAGQFVLGAGGTSVTGGLADAIQFGRANPIAGGENGGAVISAGMATAPDSFGRGTMKLNVGGTGDVQYSYYVIDGQRLNLLEIDGGTALNSLFSGTARKQKTLDSNTMNSTGVVALTGMNLVNGTTVVPDTAIGVLTISGTTAAAIYDRNTGSSVSTLQQVAGTIPSGTIPSAAFDPATGRVLVTNTIVPATLLYYYDTGKAYAIDVSPNSASHALSGQLVPRLVGSFSASVDLTGTLIGRAGGSSTAGQPNLDFAASFDGKGNYSFRQDLTTTNTSIGTNGQVADFNTSDIFLIDNSAAGHGTFQLLGGELGDPNSSAEDIVSFYFIGPRQFVAIGNAPGVASGVFYFDPE